MLQTHGNSQNVHDVLLWSKIMMFQAWNISLTSFQTMVRWPTTTNQPFWHLCHRLHRHQTLLVTETTITCIRNRLQIQVPWNLNNRPVWEPQTNPQPRQSQSATWPPLQNQLFPHRLQTRSQRFHWVGCNRPCTKNNWLWPRRRLLQPRWSRRTPTGTGGTGAGCRVPRNTRCPCRTFSGHPSWDREPSLARMWWKVTFW